MCLDPDHSVKEARFSTGTKMLDIKYFGRFSFNQSSPLLPVFSVFNHSYELDFVKCFSSVSICSII